MGRREAHVPAKTRRRRRGETLTVSGEDEGRVRRGTRRTTCRSRHRRASRLSETPRASGRAQAPTSCPDTTARHRHRGVARQRRKILAWDRTRSFSHFGPHHGRAPSTSGDVRNIESGGGSCRRIWPTPPSQRERQNRFVDEAFAGSGGSVGESEAVDYTKARL